MQLLYARCAGLDVHAQQVVACARLVVKRRVTYHRLRVSTTTRGLLDLGEWLSGHEVTHVVMEATGVYWKPVWHLLEGQCDLLLANAQHVRNVPGRKSDVNDAQWLADLLAVGLIRGSFVPPTPVQELRDLTRTRKQLVREIARHTQRLQKTLEDANLKLTEAISDIRGQSGRAILHALVAGETDPERLVALTRGLRAPRETLVDALRGRVTSHHRFMLQLHLEQITALERGLATLEQRLGEALASFRAACDLLTAMPGISQTVAAVILAEVGDDVRPFPTAGHLISWAGLAPRLDESAGKRRSTRTRPSAPWLKTTLVQAAWAAARTKKSYFHAQFLRLKSRRGPKKAILAVAASMLTAIYYMFRDGVEFRDLGAQYFTQRDKTQITNRLLRRLRDLGVDVEVRNAA
ncbi:MAG: IS110 family transposase [Myxococcales bacterium]|nr:IS110 family transposase [Myxococcales bacterium]